jgi:predicted MPP superfamily phosphohydrolase
MRTGRIVGIFLAIIILTDIYVVRNALLLIRFEGLNIDTRYAIPLYVVLSAVILGGLIYAGTNIRKSRDPHIYTRILWIMGLFLMTFLPKLAFSVAGIISDALLLVDTVSGDVNTLEKARMIVLHTGFILAVLLMLAIAMGMIRGRFNVKVVRKTIRSKNLPAAFDGLKIVQVSDMHISAFYYHRKHIKKWVDRINAMKPDLFLFTGDMVNNFAEELDTFIPILRELSPGTGKYAILGNHDYGKYFNWKSEEAEKGNIEKVKENIRKTGMDLLLNEHRIIERNGEKIALIGVENFGKPPFPQYGDLTRGLAGAEHIPFKILMSHDPYHWEQEVKKSTDIDLTLSGHTHGFQFGFEIGKLKWSPSRWQYKHWAGLHNLNGQYINVNRGFGYVGFPGRVGIRPEITEITLKKA